jgi:phage tail-like protein
MADRTTPYGAFNFQVNFGGPDPASPIGGFSEVTGLTTEVTVAEYRVGNSKINHVQKVPGLHKVGDVTLKRGVISSADLWKWIQDTRSRGPLAKRDVTITMFDETNTQVVQTWTLGRTVPLKYTAPSLNAKGGTDVAIEELVLSAESVDSK